MIIILLIKILTIPVIIDYFPFCDGYVLVCRVCSPDGYTIRPIYVI